LKIGSKVRDAFLIKTQLLSSVLTDRRFDNADARVNISGSTILVDLRVNIAGTGINVPLQFSTTET